MPKVRVNDLRMKTFKKKFAQCIKIISLPVATGIGYESDGGAMKHQGLIAILMGILLATNAMATELRKNPLVDELNTQEKILEKKQPIPVQRSSYANAKNVLIGQVVKPVKSWDHVVAVADFRQIGRLDMVAVYQVYEQSRVSQLEVESSIGRGETKFFSRIQYSIPDEAGIYRKSGDDMIGCLHPRKAIVADFNGDQYPDIVIACHGYDAGSFPGEVSLLLLNNKSGGFSVKPLMKHIGFYHAMAAYDFEGNGYSDLIVSDGLRRPNVYVLRNMRDGTFKEEANRIFGLNDQIFRYHSLEILDLNNDDVPDLIVGGNEDLNPTMILYGDKKGQFGGLWNSKKLPSVKDRTTVLDFTVVTNAGTKGLYISRTTGDRSPLGYYNAQTLQYINLDTQKSVVVHDKIDQKDNWIAWWVPVFRNGVMGVRPYATVDNRGGASDYFYAP